MIELVVQPSALAAFRRLACEIGVCEFASTEVYRAGSTTVGRNDGLYRERESSRGFQSRLKLEFSVRDEDVQLCLHRLLEVLNPDTLAVFQLEPA